MAKIYITGITGFLGSNIAGYLIRQGHHIVATYRTESSKGLCVEFENKVDWILQDEHDDWIDSVITAKPSVVIHGAWLGVGHQERDDWEKQLTNIDFLKKILFITGKVKAGKFIGLGSQAEYGIYNGCINEEEPLRAYEAYGCVKIICTEMVKQYCSYFKIDWYWLRLFSFFGKGEADNWLIPSLVKKMVMSDHMDFTAGEQQYSYLYVSDLGLAIENIIQSDGKSGIYNIAGKKLITLKSLIESIRDNIDTSFQLNFGKLPYRPNQSLHMQGDSSKFVKSFGAFEASDFNNSLADTIAYLKIKYNNQVNESI